MIILTLLQHLKPLKTDRKSIVDQDSLNITSVATLGCPFMPKEDPRCVKTKIKNVTRTRGARKAPADGRAPPRSCYVFDFFYNEEKIQYSTVQYCTELYSTVQHCTVLHSTVQYYAVLCSTVQYCTGSFIRYYKKKKSKT